MTDYLCGLSDHLCAANEGFVVDRVIGYRSLTLFFSGTITDYTDILTAAEQYRHEARSVTETSELIRLPVWYSEESGSDLLHVAQYCDLSVDEVITLHTETIYVAAATGFAPGFAYLGYTPESLKMPRLDTPRRVVPAGSVAIADRQTAVYPSSSPGGWRLIGRCPTRLFSLDWDPPVKIQVGDRVQFYPICQNEFAALGGFP